jgi:hypothetical protein
MIPSYGQPLKWLASLPSLTWAMVAIGFLSACFMFKVRTENGKPLLFPYIGLGVLPSVVILGSAASMYDADFKYLYVDVGAVLLVTLIGGGSLFIVAPFSVGFTLGGAVFKALAGTDKASKKSASQLANPSVLEPGRQEQREHGADKQNGAN